ncbi:putative virulence effector [Golovinomyces cichoracearum]|uniref:Putative virulence effector n=1 Tax=Golovinomyces cichoracearum TaxID=62708 RepID=A0A420J463_9PEZI|nr:putative virulence effector [Golovinomyces cichoracearum]
MAEPKRGGTPKACPHVRHLHSLLQSPLLHSDRERYVSPIFIPLNAFEKIRDIEVIGNISKATEKAFDKEREVIAERGQIAEVYSRALDEATSCVQELGLEDVIGQLEEALAQVLKRFSRRVNLFGVRNVHTGLSQSIHATSQGTASSSKTSCAKAIKSYFPNVSQANLPRKPCNPVSNLIPPGHKTENRIFVRLPETNASRSHHIHAVKAALRSILGPEGDSVKAIQKVKSGTAIVPIDEKHVEKLLE